MWIQYREIFQPEFWHIFNREVKLSASLKQKSTEIVLLSVGNMRRTKSLVNFLAVLISSIGCGLHNQEWKQLKTWLIFPNAFYISFHIHFTFFFFFHDIGNDVLNVTHIFPSKIFRILFASGKNNFWQEEM